jgi:hypothetical protein
VIRSEHAVHDLGELSLEAAQSLPGRLGFGNLAAVVLLAESRVHHLDARREMERIVQRAIPGPTQAVTADVPAGSFDRGRSRVAGVVLRGGEARDVTGMTKDLGCEHVADSEDLRQCAATCSDGLGTSLPIDPEVAVQPSHIRDERSRHALAFVLDSGHGANRREQRGSQGDAEPTRGAGNTTAAGYPGAAGGAGGAGGSAGSGAGACGGPSIGVALAESSTTTSSAAITVGAGGPGGTGGSGGTGDAPNGATGESSATLTF